MAGVIWSKEAGGFFDRDTREPLSREEAFRTVKYDETISGARDSLGRFVPQWVFREEPQQERILTAGGPAGTERASTRIRYEVVSEEYLEGRTIQPNQQVNVIITYRMPDGSLQRTTVSGGLGRTPDLSFLSETGQAKADADMREGLGQSYRKGRREAIEEIAPQVVTIEYQLVTITTLR